MQGGFRVAGWTRCRPAKLEWVRVEETENNFFEYSGE